MHHSNGNNRGNLYRFTTKYTLNLSIALIRNYFPNVFTYTIHGFLSRFNTSCLCNFLHFVSRIHFPSANKTLTSHQRVESTHPNASTRKGRNSLLLLHCTLFTYDKGQLHALYCLCAHFDKSIRTKALPESVFLRSTWRLSYCNGKGKSGKVLTMRQVLFEDKAWMLRKSTHKR